jgi:Flp pilus assembly protein TadD
MKTKRALVFQRPFCFHLLRSEAAKQPPLKRMSESGQRENGQCRESQVPTGTSEHRRVVATCIGLVSAVLLVFGQSVRHQFVNYDDDEYFAANPAVQAGLTQRSVAWAFTSTHAANWHPLTWLSLMLDVELFGPGPGGPHFTNVLLHAANTVLLFLVLLRMTNAHWRSALVAALFALHPLHVESVAWVSERKDVLSMFFGLLALLAYAKYASRTTHHVSRITHHEAESPIHCPPSTVWRSYALALSFFALSLMSKPMFVTLPFVMLLLDFWPLQRVSGVRCQVSGTGPTPERSVVNRHSAIGNRQCNWALVIREKIPFFILSAVSCWITMAAQSGAVQPLNRLSLGIRTVNAVVSFGRYLGKTFWPVDLAIPYPHYGYGSFRLFCACAALLLAVTLCAVWAWRRFPFLFTGWFWFLGTLVPVIGLVQVGMQSMADRYTYLPLIGVFIIVAWGGSELFERWKLPGFVPWSLAVLVLASLAARAAVQVGFWKDSETLFLHSIAVTQGNDAAHYNLGDYYFQQGRYDDAVRHHEQAIAIRPSNDDALNNLGAALAMKGELDAAAARIREAIRLRPDRADAHYNLGNVLVMQCKLDEAESAYAEALRLKPDYPEAHNNLANVLVLQGRREEAAQHYRETLRLNPNHAAARRQLHALETAP